MLIKKKPKKKFKWLASGLFITVGLAVVVFIGVALGKETYRKYQIQKEIDSLQQEAEKVSEKNQELRQLIEYYQTDAYKELEARKKLGLQKKGEKVVIIKSSPEIILIKPAILNLRKVKMPVILKSGGDIFLGSDYLLKD